MYKPPSSRGLGHLPFTEVTGIRIPLGVLIDNGLGCLGLEPRTYRLKAEYSTIELATLRRLYYTEIFQKRKKSSLFN